MYRSERMLDYNIGGKISLLIIYTTDWNGVLLIMGDINIDLLPDYHATRTVQYKNILNCFNLHQHVQRPTCVNRHRYLRLESLSKGVFERRRSTRIEVFSLTICLDAKKFVLISFFSLIRTIYLRVSTKPPLNDAQRPLPFDVRRSKTLLHKLPVDSPREYDD